jgi:glutamyl-tRNA synthetase
LEWEDPATNVVSTGYRESGYFPEAVVNFLALLGWNPGTEQEIFSMQELINLFSLDRVSKRGAKFDYEKGKWFNHKYLQVKPIEELTDIFQHILVEKDIFEDSGKVRKIVELVRDRADFVNDLWEKSSYFFEAPDSYDEKTVRKRWKEDTPAQMKELKELLSSIDDFSSQNTETKVKQWIEQKGYNLGGVMNALRLSLVGAPKGVHLFDITEIIGKNETLSRIERAVDLINN